MIFWFIQAEKANHHVRTLCRLLGVSSSGYYAFCARPPSRRALADLELTEQILAVHEASRRNYGAPRIHAALRFEGHRCAKKRVARLMRRACIQGAPTRRRYRTTRRAKAQPIAPDLLRRDFTAPAPNRVWVADITYVRTGEGFLHLAAIEDLFSRAVVGWSMAPHLRAELVAEQGDCDWNGKEWVFICYNSWTVPGSNAFTLGSTINTSLLKSTFATINCGGLLAHETKHSDQWAILGPVGFPIAYGFDAGQAGIRSLLTGGSVGKNMLLERWAGLKGGDYQPCGC